MRTRLAVVALLATASNGLAQPDAPYVGKWKVNLEKSNFGQLTIMYEAVDGGFDVSMDGASYRITTDGKPAKTPWGSMQSLSSVDANTYVAVNRLDGKLLGTDTMRISADGRRLTIDSRVMKASGEASTDRVTLRRISGTSGLAGKWQAENVKSNAPSSLHIAAKPGGLVLTFVDQNGVCDATFGGAESAVTGPMFDKGWTCAVTANGERGFGLTITRDGKPMYKSVFTVSADGRTLTETGGAIATSEKVTVVYDRQ